MGTKGECQGRWGRSVEVGEGDLGGGRVRGELAPFVFIFAQMKRKKKKKSPAHIVLQIPIPIERLTWVDRRRSLDNSDVPLNAKLIIMIHFRSNLQSFFSNFLLGAKVHPPKRKTTTPTSPIRSTSLVATLRMC